MTLLETPLKAAHESLGARMVPFAGWSMPVQYAGILDEAVAVRTKAGLFDLSHMGRVRVRGRDAIAFLQRLQTNDAATLAPGQIRYSLLLNEQGLTQDDILVYRDAVEEGSYFLVINAGNTVRDLANMHALAKGFSGLQITDQTRELGMFAIQGPLSQEIAQSLTDSDLASLKYYYWRRARVAGVDVEVSRTGYTGEDGFEVYVAAARTQSLWDAFLQKGRSRGLVPTGLGSRDTLRLEAGMPLYGHEIDETTNPLEAGLGWAVKTTHDFVGRAALEAIQKKGGTGRKLVGLVTTSKRVPRQGYEVWAGGKRVDTIRSGAVSPTLQTNIGTTYVPDGFAAAGTAIEFAIKDKREPATVCALPFYKRAKK